MPQPAETLLSAQTSNGDGSIVEVFEREYALIRVYGTWDGATVTAYADFDDSGTYCVLATSAWTADDIKQIYLKPGVKIKLTVSSAGASTSLSSEIV